MTDSALSEDILAALQAIVGERGLLLGDDVAMRSCDPFRDVPPAGGIIVRPVSADQIAAVMALCAERGQRIVTHGGRTGVAGGAHAGPAEIVLSLERLNAIEEIDPVAQIAIVQAGATLEAVQNAAAARGLLYPVDLGAKGTATIGGTIATNAGGNRVVRWGMTRQNLLGIEAVLPDGTVVSAMNRLVKNNTGYDLKHIFVGSEGTLGIVTRAVLRLVPAPTTHFAAFLSVASFGQVLDLLGRARRLQILSAFEVMWRDYYELVSSSDTGRSPVVADQPIYILIEGMGYSGELDTSLFNVFLEEAFDAGLIAEAVSATSGRQIADLWHVREGSEVIVREMSPFISFDISIDVSRADAFVAAAKAVLGGRFADPRYVTFGHLADNNLHFGVHIGPDTAARAREVEQCVYDVVRDFDGALTAEHGIGQFKRDFLPDHVSPGALAMMRQVRAAIDPQRLLNRDVLF